MNATAGVAGPALVLYKVSTAWPQAKFVATLQVYFLLLSGATLGARGWPDLELAGWMVSAVGFVLGVVTGSWVAAAVSEKVARNATLAVAMMGALAAVAKGVASL